MRLDLATMGMPTITPMDSITLTLPDMSCGHCKSAVTDAVQRVDPTARVDVDLGTKQVRIQSQRPAQEFKQALAEEGYPPA